MKHLLVIRLSAMGDVAISIPVLTAFSKQYPDVKLTILTRKLFVPMFSHLPNCQVFVADIKGKHKGFLGLYRLFLELKRQRIDAVVDLHSVLRTHILKIFFKLNGISVKQIDKGRKEKKALTRAKNKKFSQLRPTYLRYADVFKQIGFPLNMSELYFAPQPAINERVEQLLSEVKNFIGIAPFAAHTGKQYPFEKMKRVIENLSQDKENQLFIFGGGDAQKEIINSLSHLPNVHNVIGKLSFEEELQLISRLNAMLAMDSGNAHLSAMYGVPTLTIWGVTHPFAGFSPYGQPNENMLLADRNKFPLIPTSVYGKAYPAGYQNAITTISEEQILTAIKQILKKNG